MKKRETIGISIPIPCNEDWNKMTPKENGKHCDSCNKIVVDFTTMPTQDILLYFVNNKSQKTCGHFYKDQIGIKHNSFHHYLLNSYCKADKLKYKFVRFAAMALISFALIITGCNTSGKNSDQITGDSTRVEQIDTNSVSGKISIESDTSSKRSCNKIKSYK
jgi:hypothetical protein